MTGADMLHGPQKAGERSPRDHRDTSAWHLARRLAVARRRMEALKKLSERDPLCGIYNRRGLERELVRARAQVLRKNQPAALLYIDVDRLKVVNDTFGHLVGDLLLRAVADRLRSNVRTTDTVARLGGDEFAIVLCDLSLDRAREKAEELAFVVAEQPLVSGALTLSLSISIGIAEIVADRDLGALISAADLAMYQHKKRNAQARLIFNTVE